MKKIKFTLTLILAITLIAIVSVILTNNNKSTNTVKSISPTSYKSNPNNNPKLIKPKGIFISTHIINTLNYSSNIESECNTNPLVYCTIYFHSGIDLKKLDTQKTNSNGFAIWYWTINSLGLYKGVWKIEARVSYNGSIVSSFDPSDLIIN